MDELIINQGIACFYLESACDFIVKQKWKNIDLSLFKT